MNGRNVVGFNQSNSHLVASDKTCPCEWKSSSFAIYSDGHGCCFSGSCTKKYWSAEELMGSDLEVATGDTTNTPTSKKERPPMLLGGAYIDADKSVGGELTDRGGIPAEVCKVFGIKYVVSPTNEKPSVVFPYYDLDRTEIISQKSRHVNSEGKIVKGCWRGSRDKVALFGSHAFPKGGKTITLVFGEWDAPAAYDMLGRSWPVVSVPNGDSDAVNSCKLNYSYLDSFQEIRIVPDKDDGSLAAAREVAELFGPKAGIVFLKEYKDPNDYFRNRAGQAFKNCWYNPERQTVEHVVSSLEATEMFIEEREAIRTTPIMPYPYIGLNDKYFGIRKGESIGIVAGTNVGKSQFVGEIVHHILEFDPTAKVGTMFLEESASRTHVRLLSSIAGKPLHYPPFEQIAKVSKWFSPKTLDFIRHNQVTDAQLREYAKRAEYLDEGGVPRLYHYNHFGSNDIDAILKKAREFVHGLGVNYIVLDHLSIVVSDQESDERKSLDRICTRLRTEIVEKLGVCLIFVCHLSRRTNKKAHEEGGDVSLQDIRGSQGIAQLADAIIGLERNLQADCEVERNTTKVRVLKNRFVGLTGPACELFYDRETGRLTEVPMSEGVLKPEDEDKPVFDSTHTGETVAAERKDKFSFDRGDDVPF